MRGADDPVRGAPIFAVVLAAGSASRYGALKQLAVHRGRPLVAQAVATAEAVSGPRSLLVAGHEWQAVVQACLPMRGYFVNFEDYRGGLGASIACAARSLGEAAAAMLLILADQPLVTVAHLEALVTRWRRTPENIVATGYAGVTGPPVIFPQRCFGRLAGLRGDKGARAVLEDPAERVSVVSFEPAAVDIDRPGDLERL